MSDYLLMYHFLIFYNQLVSVVPVNPRQAVYQLCSTLISVVLPQMVLVYHGVPALT
jgi:hypothetical protein